MPITTDPNHFIVAHSYYKSVKKQNLHEKTCLCLCWITVIFTSHVIEVQEIGFKKFGTELRRGWPPADFNWQCYYMLGITTKLSVLFQILGL